MPKPKPFKQFVRQRKVKEFLSSPPHPFPEDINLLVKQQQASAINAQKPAQGPRENFQKDTKGIQTFEQEVGLTHKHMVSYLPTKTNQIPAISPTAHLSQQLKDIQYKLNNITIGKVSENITDQVIGRTRRPETGYQPCIKQRRHQLRLCYKCRQASHFKKNRPRITEHNIDPTKINYELRKSYGNTFGEAL